MAKNKFIAFTAAVSLLASASAGLIPAYANAPELTEGIGIVYDAEESTQTEKHIDVYYSGLDDLAAATFTITFPAGSVTKADFTISDEFTCSPTKGQQAEVDKGGFTINFSEVSGEIIKPTDGYVGTYILTVPEDAEGFVVTVSEWDLADFNVNTIKNDSDDVMSSITIPSSVEESETPETESPTTTPVVTEKPTLRPVETPEVPTEEPVVTEEPVQTPPVIEKGIELEYDAEESTPTEKHIDVYYSGLDDLAAATFTIAFPAGSVTKADFTISSEFTCSPTKGQQTEVDKGGFTINFSEVSGEIIKPTDGYVGTYILTVPEDAEEFVVTVSEWDLADFNVNTIKNGEEDTMSWVTVPKFGEEEPTETATPEPFEGKEVKFDDIAKVEDTVTEGDKTGELAFVTVTVTKENGQEAENGTDYVAKYGDVELTKTQYDRLIAGASVAGVVGEDVTVSDRLGNLSFVFSDDVNSFKVTPAYEMSDGTYAEDPNQETETVVKPEASETPSAKPTEKPTESPTKKPSEGGSSGGSNTGSSGNKNPSGSGQIARPGGTTTTTPGGTSTVTNFQDLDSVPWAVEAINALASINVINGRSATIFDPNASVTRAEFTKMVCNAFGIAEMPNATQTFTDVTSTDWFYGYVMAAASNGIVNGVSATAFDPNATIKRQEMAAILYRAIQATGMMSVLPAGTANNFSDYDQIDDYAKTPVTTLSAAGVINGTSATTFEPYATATRAQAACIIYQYYDAIGAV